MSDQLSKPLISIALRAGGNHSWSGRYGEKKNLCSCRTLNPSRPAPSSSLYRLSYPAEIHIRRMYSGNLECYKFLIKFLNLTISFPILL
jgi:hypothetical protein